MLLKIIFFCMIIFAYINHYFVFLLFMFDFVCCVCCFCLFRLFLFSDLSGPGPPKTNQLIMLNYGFSTGQQASRLAAKPGGGPPGPQAASTACGRLARPSEAPPKRCVSNTPDLYNAAARKRACADTGLREKLAC